MIQEKKVDDFNEIMLTEIFRQYWMPPMMEYLKSWRPMESEINLADVIEKWSAIIPPPLLNEVI